MLEGGGGGGGGAAGLLNKGGGSNRFPGVVTKQQALEFPQVQTSCILIFFQVVCFSVCMYVCMLVG